MAAVEQWLSNSAGKEHITEQAVESTGPDQVTPAPPIDCRLLFINVAAKRAKQLHRGAKPRVDVIDGREKAERLAMEEIRRGLIPYEVLNE